MSHQLNNALYNKLVQKDFKPLHVAEVGVYFPETSNIYNYIIDNIRCTLVEPDPDSIERIRNHFKEQDNIQLYTLALSDHAGTLDLVQRGASTFSSTLTSSPSIINDNYTLNDADKFTVEAATFDTIDDGSIDLISIDIEGGEWFVIKHMISRPAVISIETHGAAYINPYFSEIQNWIRENNYSIWYKDNTDTVYVNNKLIPISKTDRFKLLMKNIHLPIRRMKKKIKLKLKSLFK